MSAGSRVWYLGPLLGFVAAPQIVRLSSTLQPKYQTTGVNYNRTAHSTHYLSASVVVYCSCFVVLCCLP